jgi:hypothetical protein
MSRIEDEIANDLQSAPVASSDVLDRIVGLANELKEALQEAERLGELADQAARRARQIQEQTLPALMDEVGVPEIVINDGEEKLKRTEAVFASIPKAEQSNAASWLEENGFGALVKGTFVIKVDKTDEHLRSSVQNVLNQMGVDFEFSSSIHPSTLKAFVRERIENGGDVPKSITYHVQPTVAISTVRKKK